MKDHTSPAEDIPKTAGFAQRKGAVLSTYQASHVSNQDARTLVWSQPGTARGVHPY